MIVLGLAGQAGVGKDTVADYLADQYGFVKFAFSDALYREVRAAFQLPDEDFLRDRDTKQMPAVHLRLGYCRDVEFVKIVFPLLSAAHPEMGDLTDFSLSPRQVLQWWGTDYRRAQDENYWIAQVDAWIFKLWEQFQYPEHRPQYFVECGTRFPNEQAWIHKFTNGQVWHIHRDGVAPVNDHVSTQELPVLPGERELWNNDTIARLHGGIEKLLTTQAKFVRVEPMLPMVAPEETAAQQTGIQALQTCPANPASGESPAPVDAAAAFTERYDWQEAFIYAKCIRTAYGCSAEPFIITDVSKVIAACAGANDESSWMMVGELRDGRFFFLEAWCDYTGWDCQAGGDAQVADSLDNLVQFGMTEEARGRLSLSLPVAPVDAAARIQ